MPSARIRPATEDDLAAITELYNRLGVATTASYDLEPVTVDDRRAWMGARIRAGHAVLVAEVDRTIVGYGAYGSFRPWAGYARTVEHSIYVADDQQGSGIGRMLVNALVDHARGQGMHVMVGVLDSSNESSLAFHERLGFVEVGRLREVGRKFDRWLDVVLVQRML